MFTEEEKIRAIELYFKYGKKLAPVVRELGYPSKRNLRRWIRSWEAGGGAKESIRHKHRYSDEQKQVAVEHYLNHGCCLAFTSRALAIPALMYSLAGLMNFIPTDDVYLPVRPTRLRPLNQKSNVRLSWHSVHDKYQPVRSPGVLVSVVRYCINRKMKLSATVLTRLCVNITNLPWRQNAMRCGRKSPD